MVDIDDKTLTWIQKYFNEGYGYKDIVLMLSKKHNVVISLRTLERHLKKHEMRRKCFVESSLNEIVVAIESELEGSGKNLGYRLMKRKILEEYGVRAKYKTVLNILRVLDPDGIERRSRYRLKRRIYTVKGPNFIWHMDGHDRLNRFGFSIHGAIDGFSKKVIWLEVSSSNKNPHVIAHYYLSAIKERKCLPALLRPDAGTENPVVETMHWALRYGQGDELAGQNSFLVGKSVHNQRIESFWAQLRGLVTGFYIQFFKVMEAKDLLDTHDKVQVELLRFCFGPLIQHDLRKAKKVWNLHRIRKQPSRDIRGGKPNVLYYLPENFNAIDCKKPVDERHIKILQEKYAQQPRLYREGFKEIVIDVVLPGCPTPCCVEEAFDLYKKLLQKIVAMRTAINMPPNNNE